MGKPAAGRPASASASRTIWTWSANLAVGAEPAPKKPSPSRTARRSADGALAPNQIGGEGVWDGVGAPAPPLPFPNTPPQGKRGAGPPPLLTPRPPRDPPTPPPRAPPPP